MTGNYKSRKVEGEDEKKKWREMEWIDPCFALRGLETYENGKSQR
jgi:hypothetical protein